MKPKILVADDSQTIQKVIKITLAGEEFELIECTSDENLIEMTKAQSPTLVMLDFNLSENKTGYDLAREIKNCGVSKILMLYGTFDTVDENLLSHSGVNDHIVKPFEGSKFVSLCHRLIEDATTDSENSFQEMTIPDEIQEMEVEQDFTDEVDEDNWVVNQPNVIEEENDFGEEDTAISLEEKNELEKSMQDWGVDVPNIIAKGKASGNVEMPPVIDKAEASVVEIEEYQEDESEADIFIDHTEDPPIGEDDDSSLPASSDLEYPDMDKIREAVEVKPTTSPASKLISIEELSAADISEMEIEGADFEGTDSEEGVSELEAQIADEVGDEDLWAADIIINDGTGPVEDDEDDEAELDMVSRAVNAGKSINPAQLSEEQIGDYLEPIIEKIVAQRVEAIIEKIAWEVIPDLAENIIKRELEKLAQDAKDS